MAQPNGLPGMGGGFGPTPANAVQLNPANTTLSVVGNTGNIKVPNTPIYKYAGKDGVLTYTDQAPNLPQAPSAAPSAIPSAIAAGVTPGSTPGVTPGAMPSVMNAPHPTGLPVAGATDLISQAFNLPGSHAGSDPGIADLFNTTQAPSMNAPTADTQTAPATGVLGSLFNNSRPGLLWHLPQDYRMAEQGLASGAREGLGGVGDLLSSIYGGLSSAQNSLVDKLRGK